MPRSGPTSPGRPPLSPGQPASIKMCFRLTPDDRAKLEALVVRGEYQSFHHWLRAAIHQQHEQLEAEPTP